MNKEEATLLLKELGANQLVNPNLVLPEQVEADKFQLQIRGDFNRQQICTFLKSRHLSLKMNNEYLVISKP